MMRPLIVFLISITVGINSSAYATNLLNNPGFETFENYVGPWPSTYGRWKGDISEVVGPENGVVPFDSGMLKFVNTRWGLGYPNGQSGDLVQLINLAPYFPLVTTGAARVRFSAHFNRVADSGAGTIDTAFSVRLFARSDAFRNFADNVLASLAFNEALLTSNNDPSTWELASGVLDIPADATYLAIMLRVTENVVNDTTNEFAGHYADNVMVSFVPEPSSLLLLGLSVVGSMGRRRRS